MSLFETDINGFTFLFYNSIQKRLELWKLFTFFPVKSIQSHNMVQDYSLNVFGKKMAKYL